MSMPARPFGPVLIVETLLVVEALLLFGHLYTKYQPASVLTGLTLFAQDGAACVILVKPDKKITMNVNDDIIFII